MTERPEDCECNDIEDPTLPCWPCARAGYDDVAPADNGPSPDDVEANKELYDVQHMMVGSATRGAHRL